MPVYCYKCISCGEKLEVFQKYSNCEIRECPECNGQMERIISPVGVIFKGSGFHITDYKKESNDGAKGSKKEDKDTQKEDKTDKAEKQSENKESKEVA